MERNEPTTADIVRALRCDGDANNCVDCRYATYDTATILCDQEQNVRDAAARLESQERELSVLRDVSARQDDRLVSQEGAHIETMRELSGITGELERMTARAEQAERERDAAVEDLEKSLFAKKDFSMCYLCQYRSTNGRCVRKNIGIGCKPKWRGLRGKGNA